MITNTRWYRISDIERLSGIPRRTIHFYLQEGLLHQPRRTGKTMAYYDDRHLEELAFIRRAKNGGMPLTAIRTEIHAGTVRTEARRHPGRDSSVTERGYKTRENILRLACELLREKGYRNTKVTDITSELNIGKGTFYFYFSDKKELLLECVPRIFNELFSEGWNMIRRERDPLKRLELRARAVLPVLHEFCAIVQLSKEAIEDPDPKVHSLGEKTLFSIRRPLESDITKGIEKGVFRQVDPLVASTVMIGIMESINFLAVTGKTPSTDSLWNSVVELITSGLRGSPGAEG